MLPWAGARFRVAGPGSIGRHFFLKASLSFSLACFRSAALTARCPGPGRPVIETHPDEGMATSLRWAAPIRCAGGHQECLVGRLTHF